MVGAQHVGRGVVLIAPVPGAAEQVARHEEPEQPVERVLVHTHDLGQLGSRTRARMHVIGDLQLGDHRERLAFDHRVRSLDHEGKRRRHTRVHAADRAPHRERRFHDPRGRRSHGTMS